MRGGSFSVPCGLFVFSTPLPLPFTCHLHPGSAPLCCWIGSMDHDIRRSPLLLPSSSLPIDPAALSHEGQTAPPLLSPPRHSCRIVIPPSSWALEGTQSPGVRWGDHRDPRRLGWKLPKTCPSPQRPSPSRLPLFPFVGALNNFLRLPVICVFVCVYVWGGGPLLNPFWIESFPSHSSFVSFLSLGFNVHLLFLSHCLVFAQFHCLLHS